MRLRLHLPVLLFAAWCAAAGAAGAADASAAPPATPALSAAAATAPRPVPATPPAPVPPLGPAPPATFTSTSRLSAQEWRSDETMHQFFVDWFFEADGWGGFGSTLRVGITLHDRMRLIVPGSGLLGGASARRPKEYNVTCIELIGLARHDPPAALDVTFHRPSPAMASSKRALTEFEQTALAGLRLEGGAVVSDDGAQRLVVGPIRARAECLSCHTGYKTGDLLGAFSYRLAPVETPPAAP